MENLIQNEIFERNKPKFSDLKRLFYFTLMVCGSGVSKDLGWKVISDPCYDNWVAEAGPSTSSVASSSPYAVPFCSVVLFVSVVCHLILEAAWLPGQLRVKPGTS